MKKHNDLQSYKIDEVPKYLVNLKKKLRELREEYKDNEIKKLTQRGLADLFVSKGYLKTCDYRRIQVAEDTSSSVHPSLQLLLAYQQLFDCDIDNLLGILDYKKHDEKFICEYTGLSQDAVRKLHEEKKQSIVMKNFLKKYYEDNDVPFQQHNDTVMFLRITGELKSNLVSRIILNPSLLDLIAKYHSYTNYSEQSLQAEFLNDTDDKPSLTEEQNKTRRIFRKAEYNNLQKLVTKGIEDMISSELVSIIKELGLK